MTSMLTTGNDGKVANGDRYLTVTAVAERLGLPVELVMRRVEAGHVPARRVEIGQDGEYTYEVRLADLGLDVSEETDTTTGVEQSGVIQLTGSVSMSREQFEAAGADDPELRRSHQSPLSVVEEDDNASVDEMVPPPSRSGNRLSVVGFESDPINDISRMQLDSRELVVGLLERWEHALEQRIYAELRQRFEAELLARQTMVKEAQMELRTARAEHVAAQAEQARVIATREHSLSEVERELDQARRAAQQAQIQLQAQHQRKRGWFFRR